MVGRHGFVRKELDTLFRRVRLDPDIIRLMTTPPEVRSWQAYRTNFVNERRIAAGVQFWAQHAAALERAEARYGVPAEAIVGIIGVETEFGRNTGAFRVVDALATLAFDYPRRADFFRAFPIKSESLRVRIERALDSVGFSAGRRAVPP